MAKRGSNKHMKRIAAPKSIPLSDKKEKVWLIKTQAGPHEAKHAMPLAVLLREVLGLAKTRREVRIVLKSRSVFIDGKPRVEEKFPVGLMDIVSFPSTKKYYRIAVDGKGRLVPLEIDEKEARGKICAVKRKYTAKKGKTKIMLHDGKNLDADNNVHVGDSVIISVPGCKIEKLLKLDKGARCLVKDGKHAGVVATLEEVLGQEASRQKRARMKGEEGEFITAMKHLCVVDEGFRGAGQ